jgi:putative ABC transport system permease protein
MALAVSMIILSHVKTELSYDKNWPKADRIYRIINKTYGQRGEWNWANGAPLMAEQIQSFVPEIELTARIRPMDNMIIENREDTSNIIKYEESRGFFADSTIFDILDIHLHRGTARNALIHRGSMVLTEDLAYKIFGDEDPVGRILYFDRFGEPLTVTAVMSDFPETSHLKISFFVDWQSFVYMMKILGLEDLYNEHGWAGVYTYALLKDNVKTPQLKSRLLEFRKDFFGAYLTPEDTIIGEFVMQPITEIHLRSNLEQEMGPNGNIAYILVFSIAAIFILIIAGVNYVNIATSRTFKRIKEVGIRKVAGATRMQIVHQFQGESLFTIFVSAVISVLLIDLIIPIYNFIAGKNITTGDIFTPFNIILFMMLVITMGSISGIYPSIFASGFKPVSAIKETNRSDTGTHILRNILIILQFAISVFMIFSTIEIYRQMKYFNEKNLGFDKTNVINIELNGSASRMAANNPQILKDELQKLPYVLATSLTSTLIGDRFSVEGWIPDQTSENFNNPSLRFLRVDEDFLKLLNIRLVDGRNFQRPSGTNSEFIINELAIDALNLDDPIGEKGTAYFGTKGEIVGVTENFNFASLHNQVEPLVLEYNLDTEYRKLFIGNMLVKLAPGNHPKNIEELKNTIEKIAPGTTFNYIFLDDKFEQLYKSEVNFRNMIEIFTVFTILISCLGLFGLSSYTAESRTKEIGIRKSMGAKTGTIAFMITSQLLRFVMFGLLISLPAGYLYINSWLNNFAYHIDVRPWEFILTSVIAFLVAIISVGYQAFRAGRRNPIDSLRYE